MKELESLYISFQTKGLNTVRDRITKLDTSLRKLLTLSSKLDITNTFKNNLDIFKKELFEVQKGLGSIRLYNSSLNQILLFQSKIYDRINQSVNKLDTKKIKSLSSKKLRLDTTNNLDEDDDNVIKKNTGDKNDDDDDDKKKFNWLRLLGFGAKATPYVALYVALKKVLDTVKNISGEVFKTAEDFNYLSKEVGISTNKLQAFSNAEKLVGGKGNGVINLIKSLNEGLISMKYGEMPANFETAMKRYGGYGLDLFRNKDAVSLLNNISSTMANIKDAREKADLANILGIDEKTLRLMIDNKRPFEDYITSGEKLSYLKDDSSKNISKTSTLFRKIGMAGKKGIGSGITFGVNTINKVFQKDNNYIPNIPNLNDLGDTFNNNNNYINNKYNNNNTNSNSNIVNNNDNSNTTNNINININNNEGTENLDEYLLDILNSKNRNIK